MLQLPTADELKAARAAMVADGPEGDGTVELAALAINEDPLWQFTQNIANRTHKDYRALIIGSMVWGLNMGLRVGEARVDAALQKAVASAT